MACRVNNCGCCSLKTGVFIYAVLYAFGAVILVVSAIFQSPETTPTHPADSDLKPHEYANERNFQLGSNVVDLLKAIILLYGVLKENRKALFAFVIIEGIFLLIKTIIVIIIAFVMPPFAVVLVAIAIQAFLLVFVYSYYKELDEKSSNTNERVGMSNKV